MDERVKITAEQFQSFLQDGYNKNLVMDWLALAKMGFVPFDENRKWENDKASRPYVRFYAYFLPFSHLASHFYFAFCKKDYDKPIEEMISFFIKQLTLQDSAIFPADYNPAKENNLSVLLVPVDKNISQIETADELFKNICIIHRKIFKEAQEVDEELLNECNDVLKGLLSKLNIITG